MELETKIFSVTVWAFKVFYTLEFNKAPRIQQIWPIYNWFIFRIVACFALLHSWFVFFQINAFISQINFP